MSDKYICLTCKEKKQDAVFESLDEATKHVQANVGHRVSIDVSTQAGVPRVSVYDDKLNPEAEEIIKNIKSESYDELLKKGIRVEHPKE